MTAWGSGEKGDPVRGLSRDRFTEDALRILRAIRFAAQLGFSIEGETYGAIREIAPNLKNVSKERIQVELTKLLTSAHPEKIAMVEDTGISPYVTGDFPWYSRPSGRGRPEGHPGRSPFPAWLSFRRRNPCAGPDSCAIWSRTWCAGSRKGLKLDNETVDNGKVMAGAAQAPLGPEKAGIRRF